MDKQRFEPPPPRQLLPDLPEDLDALCVDLLRRHPESRPTGRDVLRRLGSVPVDLGTSPSRSSSGQAIPLIGREPHLEALADAFAAVRRGRTVAFYLHGRSGVGKSALVRSFLDGLAEREGAVVLAGRCYERESVPYKALDGVVDALSRYLGRLPHPEVLALLPRDVRPLARIFPVLQRAAAVPELRHAPEVLDPQELRRRGFAALRELLARLGRPQAVGAGHRRPAVGGPRQRGAALRAAAAPRPPRPAAAGQLPERGCGDEPPPAGTPRRTGRGGCGPRPARDGRRGTHRAGSRDPGVGRCSAGRARARGPWPTPSPGSRGAIRSSSPSSCGISSPGTELADRSPSRERITLDEVLWSRIVRLPEEARRLLEVISVAGRPLSPSEACRAAGLEADERATMAILPPAGSSGARVPRRSSRSRPITIGSARPSWPTSPRPS